jgi:hypothetical protein
MASTRTSVHIMWPTYMAIAQAATPVDPKLFDAVNDAKDGMISQLLWWAQALKAAREENK